MSLVMPTWVIVRLQKKVERGKKSSHLKIFWKAKKRRGGTIVSFWIWTDVYFKNGHFGHCPTDEVEGIFSAWGNSRGILRKGPVVSHGASLSRGTLPRFCPKPQGQNELPHWEWRFTIWENPKNYWNPIEISFPPGRISFPFSVLPRSHLL